MQKNRRVLLQDTQLSDVEYLMEIAIKYKCYNIRTKNFELTFDKPIDLKNATDTMISNEINRKTNKKDTNDPAGMD